MGIFFITGTSGSGKTILTHNLKLRLPRDFFEVYDFDEAGVPENPNQAWRQKTTEYWLTKALQNSAQNKSTIICGVTVPSEILSILTKSNIPIYFGFMKISDQTIQERLKARGWSDQLIEDNINWAQYLEAEVKKQQHSIIIDSSLNGTQEEIAYAFIQWIYLCNSN